LLSGYFDTETGPKREADSYRRIVAAIGQSATEILFLSDITEELDAAHAAGLHTILLARAPAVCPASTAHSCVATFNDIHLT
jgi:enolase-phosphatase E1